MQRSNVIEFYEVESVRADMLCLLDRVFLITATSKSRRSFSFTENSARQKIFYQRKDHLQREENLFLLAVTHPVPKGKTSWSARYLPRTYRQQRDKCRERYCSCVLLYSTILYFQGPADDEEVLSATISMIPHYVSAC